MSASRSFLLANASEANVAPDKPVGLSPSIVYSTVRIGNGLVPCHSCGVNCFAGCCAGAAGPSPALRAHERGE
jgi:hypothetical protein